MHPCLHLPEIFQHICNEIGGPSKSRNQQLFALALTCRHFHQPALSNLWESVDDISPIIKCAGKDILEEGRDGFLQLTRPMSLSDIETMKKYARLVRCFGRDNVPTQFISLKVWEALHVSLNGTILFPNLRFLTFYKLPLEDMKYFDLFTPQSLKSASIPGHEEWKSADFANRCPNLSSVKVSAYRISLGTIQALSKWQNLSCFNSGGVTPDVLQTLSQSSSSLRCLQFDYFSQDTVRELPSSETMNIPMFPALETMKIGFGLGRDAMEFMGYIPAGNRLRTFKIKIVTLGPDKGKAWLELLDSLKMFSNSLTNLRFFGEDTGSYFAQYLVLPSSLILDTLGTSFKLLTRIKISNVGNFIFLDEDIKKLTEALPSLQKFGLYDGIRNIPNWIIYTTTLTRLTYFAQNCPYMSKLALPFDARTDKLPRRTTYLAPGSRLKYLNVLGSPVDDPQLVAKILFTIFPDVKDVSGHYRKSLEGYNPEIGTYLRPWFEIHRLLQVHREERFGRVNTESSMAAAERNPILNLLARS